MTRVVTAMDERNLRQIDVGQALADAENALRDFLVNLLEAKYGDEWPTSCGLSAEKVDAWRQRQADERVRLRTGNPDERLIYYADFRDLLIIIRRLWGAELKAALEDKAEIEVFLNLLGNYRNPDAHRRELMPHQRALAVGISGEIRTRLVRYRSKMETRDDVYPRIEAVRDSIGTQLLPPRLSGVAQAIVHPGDTVDFVITATDPFGDPLQFALTPPGHHHEPMPWQDSHTPSFRFDESHVEEHFGINLWIKSPRKFHAAVWYDAYATIAYIVRPKPCSSSG